MSENMLGLIEPGTLVLCSTDIDAPPMTSVRPDGTRVGYEADLGRALAASLGLGLKWIDVRKWDEFLGSVLDGRCDAVLMSQAITEQRKAVVDFTVPYGVFDEAAFVRRDSGIRQVEDLTGRRVGAIDGTTNMEAARTIRGAEIVPFGHGDNIFVEMIEAVRSGEIDALIDDELVLVGIAAKSYPDLEVPFVIPTRNRYGIAVKPGADRLRAALDDALLALIASGELEASWNRWFPAKPFELGA